MKRRVLKKEAEKAEMLSRQYGRLWQAWSENAMLFHDMDNHLQTIYHLAQKGNNEEICRYISHISKPTTQLAGILWTGIGIVDAVLGVKKQLAEEKGYVMDINAQLPANTGIAEDDFCTVLANLLDNAIESMDREWSKMEKAGEDSCQNMPYGNALSPIEVSIRHIHHFVVIRVSNPCSEKKTGRHRFFSTTKKDRLRHGWGLKSVRQTVEKYNGSLSLEVEEERFVALAMMFFVS